MPMVVCPALLFILLLLLWRTSSAFGSNDAIPLQTTIRSNWPGALFGKRRWLIHGGSTDVLRAYRGGSTSNLPNEREPIPSVAVPDSWRDSSEQQPQPRRALVVMDQFSPYHGGYLTAVAREIYGVAIIRVLSNYMVAYFEQTLPEVMEPKSMFVPTTKEQLERWMERTEGVERIEAIYCESDSGLPDAEQFGELLKLRTSNGINDARRNKFKMVEAAEAYGLDTVRQQICYSVEEAENFAKELGVGSPNDELTQADARLNAVDTDIDGGVLGSGKNTVQTSDMKLCCIVKPIRGSGSDGVARCGSLAEVRTAFDEIFGTVVFGSPGTKHDCVLLQEFAVGTEYALDIVSKGGEHKVTALWRYDKRPANGAPFVYFATELISATSNDGVQGVCEYATKSLDALGLKWGLTHVEVILTQKGPRLVEVNCRQHNMDFLPIVMGCVGYNCFDLLLAAYLGGNNGNDRTIGSEPEEHKLDWDDIPSLPSTDAYGAMVHLVNQMEGKLTALNDEALMEIQSMKSVVALEIYDNFREIGEQIRLTTDIRTDAGWVQIINEDEDSFVSDYNRIVELMPTLFSVKH